jgi:predicted phosphoadenosine phosphosulfate sulfurtransferase
MDVIDEDWEEWSPEKGLFWVHMIAGSCAGLMEHVAMFPLDTYKVRVYPFNLRFCVFSGLSVEHPALCCPDLLIIRRTAKRPGSHRARRPS